MTDAERDEAMGMVKRGVAPADVARLYDVSRQYITAEARRRGIEIPKPGALKKKLLKTIQLEVREKAK